LFSTPLNKNVDTVDSALIFDALMRFVHGENVKYYTHGEDWGAIISTNLAILYPNRIRGIHLTMNTAAFDEPIIFPYMIFGQIFPNYFYTREEIEADLIGRYSLKKLLQIMLKETGYMHLHSTYPDTLSHALSDSPVGILAYILEKYSKWSFDNEREIVGNYDGSLKKYNKDDLLTIITLYWMSNSISSSIRFYKNTFAIFGADYPKNSISNLALSEKVSVGNQFFQNEIFFVPEAVIKKKCPNLVQNTIVKNGGHFGAFQNPILSANDLYSFIKKTL
jgi:pimeloyl-ACP methyl ester carboxylesterase